MKKTLTLGVVACMLLMGSSVHAQTTNTTLPSAGMLPDNPLYFLEQLSEGIANFFTFGDKAKAERLFNQSEERLSEARALVEKGKSDQAEKIIAKYQERVTKALEVAKKAKESNQNVDDVLEHIAEATSRNQEVLGEVYGKVPESAKEAIQHALEMSAKGYDTALQSISKEKIQEILNRVTTGKQDLGDRLEELRKQGVPIPELKMHDTEDMMDGQDMMDEQDMNDGQGMHESDREQVKQAAEGIQQDLEKSLENSNLTEKEREALKQAGEKAREQAKQDAERMMESGR